MTTHQTETSCGRCKRRIKYTLCEKGVIVWCKLDNGDTVWDYPRADCPDFIQEEGV